VPGSMRPVLVTLLALCPALRTGWAQEAPAAEPQPACAPTQEAAEPDGAKPGKFLPDVAGYLSFRNLNYDYLSTHSFYREYSGSVFVSKTLGRWSFHSEFNAGNAPEYDSEGIHLIHRRPSLSVKLDSAFLNYNWRDWLQVRAGFLFVPAYWRTHRYQSTTLTVDEPLTDQNVFPTAFKGLMIHGEKYFEEAGFSYALCAGNSQEPDLNDPQETHYRSGAVGGKLVLHLPTRHFLDHFDIGYQQLREQHKRTGSQQDTYGAELRLEKGRAAFLGEFAYASIGPGTLGPSFFRREYFRQGFYLQPSYRITRQLFAVARYDRLNGNSRRGSLSGLARQLAGLTYRPVPALSLKLEADRLEPRRGRLPPYYGVSVGIVYFFHLP
jgi:hypothetical protein